MFSIGLEFSFKQLMKMGRMAFGGGTLQLVLTILTVSLITVNMFDLPRALTLGAIVSDEFHYHSAAVAGGPRGNRFGQRQDMFSHSFASGHRHRTPRVDGQLLYTGGVRDEYRSAYPQGDPISDRVGRCVYTYCSIILAPALLSEAKLFANRAVICTAEHHCGFRRSLGRPQTTHLPGAGRFCCGHAAGRIPFVTQIRSDIGSMRIIMVTSFLPRWAWAAQAHMVYQTLALGSARFGNRSDSENRDYYIVGRLSASKPTSPGHGHYLEPGRRVFIRAGSHCPQGRFARQPISLI